MHIDLFRIHEYVAVVRFSIDRMNFCCCKSKRCLANTYACAVHRVILFLRGGDSPAPLI
jgi:hypothetical protein